MDRIVIQSLFCRGHSGNTLPQQADTWLERIIETQLMHVQAYTLDRPYPSKWITPADTATLLEIKAGLKKHERAWVCIESQSLRRAKGIILLIRKNSRWT